MPDASQAALCCICPFVVNVVGLVYPVSRRRARAKSLCELVRMAA